MFTKQETRMRESHYLCMYLLFFIEALTYKTSNNLTVNTKINKKEKNEEEKGKKEQLITNLA